MGQNFLSCDREQELLLPPSLREWLPDGHLAWFVLDAVATIDLTAFYAEYCGDAGVSATASFAGLSRCAEEDSNLHPVSLDQALNLVTHVSDASYASISSRTFTDLDAMDVMDDLDVAADVARDRRRFDR